MDESGEVIPGVNVRLTESSMGAASDANGNYEIRSISASDYEISFSAVGFRTEKRQVSLSVGQVLRLDLTLTEILYNSSEVVVTASRREQASGSVPVSLNIISPRAIQNQNATSIDKALRYVPGVHLMDNQVNIRGSSGFSYNTGSRVLIMLDGFPMLSPDTDGLPFDALPVTQIEQIEVIKGPSSALYGSGALGGVINVITSDFPEKPETDISLFSGVHEPARYEVWYERWRDGNAYRPFMGANLTHSRKFSPSTGAWVNLSYESDKGFKRYSELWVYRGFAKFGWRPSTKFNIDVLTGGIIREKQNFLFWNGARDALNQGQLSIGSTIPAGFNDNLVNQLNLLLNLTHLPLSNLSYTFKARLFATFIRPIDNVTLKPKRLIDGTVGARTGAELQVNWTPLEDSHITFGLTRDQLGTTSSFYLTPDGDSTSSQPELAGFIQGEYTLADRFDISLGFRYDSYQIDNLETATQLSPKLNLSYRVTENSSLRLSSGKGFRVPGLAERFTENRDFFPIISNPTIKPETSSSLELGYRTLLPIGKSGGLNLDVAAFYNRYKNLIDPRLQLEFSAFQFVNLTKAEILGFELGLDGALNRSINYQLGYTYLDTEDLTEKVPLSFRPKHMLKAGFDAKLPMSFEIGLDYRFISAPEAVDTDFVLFIPDADILLDTKVVDLWLAYRKGPFRLALMSKNAFEYYYVERPAMIGAPRSYLARLDIGF